MILQKSYKILNSFKGLYFRLYIHFAHYRLVLPGLAFLLTKLVVYRCINRSKRKSPLLLRVYKGKKVGRKVTWRPDAHWTTIY